MVPNRTFLYSRMDIRSRPIDFGRSGSPNPSRLCPLGKKSFYCLENLIKLLQNKQKHRNHINPTEKGPNTRWI